jgi:protein involved in polysaccharide export with SLBB domain
MLAPKSLSFFLLRFVIACSIIFQSALVTAQVPAGAPPAGQSLPTSAPGGLPSGTSLPGAADASGTGQGTGKQGTNTSTNTQQTTQGQEATQTKLAPANTGTDPNAPQDSTEIARQALLNRIFGHKQFSQSVFNPLQSQPIATPLSYAIGPGDQLEVSIYGNTVYPVQTVTVNRDGFISLPTIGNIYVLGKSIDEVTKLLIGKYAPYNPSLLGQGGAPPRSTLKVSLSEVRGVQVYVTGEVMFPATYELTSLHSAFNALYLSGGPNEIGTFRNIKVVRDNKEIATIDTYEYFLTGKLQNDVLIQDNDRIVVGYYDTRVEVVGNIKKPGLYEMKAGEKLSDLFRFAGGFTDDAYRARYRILRFTDRERKILDVAENEAQGFVLKSGDVITVDAVLDRFENMVSIEGAIMRPGEYALESNPTLKKLLETVQGLREDAFAGRVQVSRTRPDQSIENLSVDLAGILNGQIPDLQLSRLDVVTVPSIYQMTELATVTITGEVNNSQFGQNGGKFPYIANMTLEDLIIKADGLKESADLNNVKISRRKRDVDAKFADAQIAEVFTISIDRNLSIGGKESGIVLWPYDEILIGRSPSYKEQQYVRIEGDGVLREGVYPIENRNDKISDIVQRAGGLTELAFLPGATLVRTSILREANSVQEAEAEQTITQGLIVGNTENVVDGASRTQNIGINMTRILKHKGSKEDLVVQSGDVIRIPKRLETVEVTGEVLYPTTVKYNDGMSFLDFISQSGGFTKASQRRSSWIKYANGSVDRTRRFLVFNVYPKVQPGSEIFVPQKIGNEVTPLQLLNVAIQVSTTLMTLILSILAFRNISN